LTHDASKAAVAGCTFSATNRTRAAANSGVCSGRRDSRCHRRTVRVETASQWRSSLQPVAYVHTVMGSVDWAMMGRNRIGA